MTTTTEPTYPQQIAPAPCPAWCEQHLEDEFGQLSSPVHQRRVVVGDVYVTIEESSGVNDPVGPTVEVDQFQWVSGESVRWMAEALHQAADLIGIPATGGTAEGSVIA